MRLRRKVDGQVLEDLIADAGITLPQLAECAKVHYSTLHRLLRGSGVRSDTLGRIASALSLALSGDDFVRHIAPTDILEKRVEVDAV